MDREAVLLSTRYTRIPRRGRTLHQSCHRGCAMLAIFLPQATPAAAHGMPVHYQPIPPAPE